MTRLKLADLVDDKPVKLTVELSGHLHRNLKAYAVVLNNGQQDDAPPVERLVPAMIDRFIATDRAFRKARRIVQPSDVG